MIRQIYEWRAQGLGYGTITRMLNERDIPSPGRYRFEHGIITNNNKKGSALLWNRHALSDILRNIVYIGHLAQGKCTASLMRGIPVHRVPEAEWDIVYNTHEPIVSQALFDRVQEVNEAGANAYKAVYGTCSHLPTRSNPYREKLVCADCGTRLKLYRSMSNDRKKPISFISVRLMRSTVNFGAPKSRFAVTTWMPLFCRRCGYRSNSSAAPRLSS